MSKAKKETSPNEDAKNAIASLIDSPEIEGYEVKEWSIAQFSRLYPYFREIAAGLNDVNLDNVQDILVQNPMLIVDAVIPILPQVLSISLGKTEKEVEEISVSLATVLTMAILKKNMEHLTSFFGQLKGSIGAMLPLQKTN